MKTFLVKILILFSCFSPTIFYGQNVSLYQQFNGRMDYTAIGNTMNTSENGPNSVCEILTESSASLNLNNHQTIIATYLYWAGSGTGDFEVFLNNQPISAQRTFSNSLDENRVFFAAFADVTSLIIEQGNSNYTLSGLDLTQVIAPYCPTGTNFGGWALIVVFEDDNLPLNQVNVYDGLQSVPENLTITLDNLNVLDNEGAKIGFLAWEGDAALSVNETLSINGSPISNAPLNPVNNAFNSTNSFTNSNQLWNMDMDVYSIQNLINIGDTSATIQLTSGQDFVMINNIVTVLNSQLPDASIELVEVNVECNNFEIEVSYEVFNLNSTDVLPANTPIAFYVEGALIGITNTLNDIEINAFEMGFITLQIPGNLTSEFELIAVVDDNGFGEGIVTEINEGNNINTVSISLLLPPEIIDLEGIIACNEGFEIGTFNLLEIISALPDQNENNYSFFESLDDLLENINQINAPSNYNNAVNPQKIFIKHLTVDCFEIFETKVVVENCPPRVPGGFSPNNDGLNDWFNIQGLYNIFINHELLIYNRYGTLIFTGDNSKPWDGKTNRGFYGKKTLVPIGSYYYILKLNDQNFTNKSGWVVVNY